MRLNELDIDAIFDAKSRLVYYCEDDAKIAVTSDEVDAYAIHYSDNNKHYIQIYNDLQNAKDGYMLLLRIVENQKKQNEPAKTDAIEQLYNSMSEKIDDVAEINPRFIQEINRYKFYNYKGENINIINIKIPEFNKNF